MQQAVMITLAVAIALAAILGYVTVFQQPEPYRFLVKSAAMEPTIKVGSTLLVDLHAYDEDEPQPGEIVVLWIASRDYRERNVLRLMAVGGQTVRIMDCVQHPAETCGVYVDGTRLEGPAFQRPYYAMGRMMEQSWTVPDGEFFFLGDNNRICRFCATGKPSKSTERLFNQLFPKNAALTNRCCPVFGK